MTDQAAAGEREPSGLQNEHDLAAKAAAKKAKKQRQKAKKQLTQAQTEDLPTDSLESGGSPAHMPKPQSSTVGSSESQHSNAASAGSHAVGSTAEPQTAEQIKQESADAAMLYIFRCPITKVSSLYLSHMPSQTASLCFLSGSLQADVNSHAQELDVQHVTHLLCICISSVSMLGKTLACRW